MIYRLREVDAVCLIAAKEEGFVFLDRASHFDPILTHSNQRLGSFLRISEELIRVEALIAKEKKAGAVEFARSTAGGNRNRCSAVATFLSGGVVGRHFEFLHVVRIDAIEVADRIRYRRLVRFDPIDGDVVCAVTRAIHMYARAGAAKGPLHDTWLKQQES